MNDFLPYGHQVIDDEDVRAVVEVLRGNMLTCGQHVEQFEQAVSEYCGSGGAVAVNSGTAALHAALLGAGVGPGDEVITSPITFAATANAVLYLGATPVFADVSSETLLIDPEDVRRKITSKTRAVIPVDYAGQPCDYDALRSLATTGERPFSIIADACHSLGAKQGSRNVGALADATCFSFHPVKAITCGEGGMIVSDDQELLTRARRFRSHGIDKTFKDRQRLGSAVYDMLELGYNYRLTDFQCALGASQLLKLDSFISQREKTARLYDDFFRDEEHIASLSVLPQNKHAWHLYVVRLNLEAFRLSRDELVAALYSLGIGIAVHYRPVYLHSYYQSLGYDQGLCSKAESAWNEILSLPIFPGVGQPDVERVVTSLKEYLR